MQKFCEDNNVPMCRCGGEPRLNMDGPFVWIGCKAHPIKHKTKEYDTREGHTVHDAVSDWKLRVEGGRG